MLVANEVSCAAAAAGAELELSMLSQAIQDRGVLLTAVNVGSRRIGSSALCAGARTVA